MTIPVAVCIEERVFSAKAGHWETEKAKRGRDFLYDVSQKTCSDAFFANAFAQKKAVPRCAVFLKDCVRA